MWGLISLPSSSTAAGAVPAYIIDLRNFSIEREAIS